MSQNTCITEQPSDPKLTLGTFVTDANNCYCPLTIAYTPNSTHTYAVYFYDGENIEETINEIKVNGTAINITNMLAPTSTRNTWRYDWHPSQSGKRYLQIGLTAENEGKYCSESSIAGSSVQSIEAPCVNPDVRIQSILKKTGGSVTSSNPVAPKIDGPFTINVFAKTDENCFFGFFITKGVNSKTIHI